MQPDRRGFSPDSLPNLALWIKADSLALNDGDPVGTWADSSGNGQNAAQSTGTRKPTYKTGTVNGFPSVRFDGSSDTVTNSAFSLATTNTIYIAASTHSMTGGFQRLFGRENYFFVGREGSSPPQFASFYGDGSGWGTTPGHGMKAELGQDYTYILTTVFDGIALSAYLDGALCGSVSDTMSTSTSGGYTIGASPTPNQFWDRDICEVLVYSGVAHNDSTRQQVETYLRGRWATAPRWTRNNSPILTIAGTPNSGWESVDIANPHVFYDTPNSRWVMNYSGNRSPSGNDWNTGLAYSTDLLTWTKEASNPVFTWSGVDESGIAANGAIVLKGSTYYLYYHAGFPGKIKCATSSNLLSWTRQGVVIDVGTTGAFDESATFDPVARLMSDNTTIEIFYAGKNASGTRSIGRATSTDGITCTKQGIVFDHSSGFGDRQDNFGEPDPLGNTGTSYELWCDRAIVDGARSISRFATTDSGVTWVFKGNFNPAGGSGWDSINVFDGCKVLSNGTLYMFYAGAPNLGNAANMGAQIGVATVVWP